MRSLNEYIEIIKKCSDVLRSYFGVTSLRIFGSVARNEQNEDSDVDVCVDMKHYLPNCTANPKLKNVMLFLNQLWSMPSSYPSVL